MGFKEEMMEKVSLKDVVERRTTLHPNGKDRWKGISPFSAEKTPSFYVDDRLKVWKCFSSGKGGGIIQYFMESEGFGEEEAYEYVSRTYNIPLPNRKDTPTTPVKLMECVTAAQTFFRRGRQKAVEYIQSRGFSDSLVDSYGMGYAPDSFNSLIDYLKEKGFDEATIKDAGLAAVSPKTKGLYVRQRNRLTIPVKDKYGNIVGFIGRALGDEKPKYLNPPNSALFTRDSTLWNLDRVRPLIKKYDKVLVSEGPFDSAVSENEGVPVLSGLGSNLSDEQLSILSKMTKNIYLVFDSDDAGRSALLKSFYKLQELGLDSVIYAIVLPEGLDLADYIKDYGAEILNKLIDSAIPDSSALVEALYHEATKTSTKESAIARKVLEAAKPYLETTNYSYRALDLLDRLAQRLNLDKGKLDKYMSSGTDFKHNSKVYKKIEAITFPGEIYERRIMTECLKNPANLKVLKSMGITRFDIESYLVAKVLTLIDSNPNDYFDKLSSELNQEEYDTVMSAYMNAEAFDISIYELGGIVDAKKHKAKGANMQITNILGRPKRTVEKENSRTFKQILEGLNNGH